MSSANLERFGYSDQIRTAFEAVASAGAWPARVVEAHRSTAEVMGEAGRARVHIPPDAQPRPVAGDWVSVAGERIERVIERRTVLARKQPGRSSDAQVLAANVDVALIVSAFGRELRPRRIERYLTIAWDGGVAPIIVVNKCDLGGADLSEVLGTLAVAAPVFAVSAATGEGVEAMLSTIPACQTLALIGSSGVGKSSLLNRIAGEQLAETSAVRARDDKGRHTTTRRSSFLARDWIVIDTPGLRELGLGAASKGLSKVFEDVESAASLCRFTDCRHEGEPGCAVVDQLDPERLEHYRALRSEAENAAQREDARARKQAGRRHGQLIREAQAWRARRRGGGG